MTVGRKRILLGTLSGLLALVAGMSAAIFLPGSNQTTVTDGDNGLTGTTPASQRFVVKDGETGDIYALERIGRELQLQPELSGEFFKEMAPELENEYAGWPLHASFLVGETLVVGGPRAVHVFELEAGKWVVKQEVSFDKFPELVDESITPVPVALSEDFLTVYAAGSDSDTLLVFRREGGSWLLAHTITATGSEGLSAKFNVIQSVIDGDSLAVGVVNSDRDGVYIFDLGGEAWSLRQVVSPDVLPDLPVTFHIFSQLAFSNGKLAMAIDDVVYMLEAENNKWELKQQITTRDFPGLTGRTFAGIWTMAEMDGETLVIADSELLYVFNYDMGEWSLERNISLDKQYGSRRETGSGHGVALGDGILVVSKFAGSLEGEVEESIRVFVRDDGEWLLDKTLDL